MSRALLPLLGSPAGPGGAERAGAAEAGSGSLAKSLQRAEALWRHCVPPGLKRLLPPGRAESTAEDSSEEDDAWPSPARVERGLQGLSRCLCVQEDPRTETFQGHLRPEAAQGPFSFHAARARVAQRCATLHALLQHRHRLQLARHYSRRLRAACAFVRRLGAVERRPPPGCPGRLLRELCEELRTHAAHWDGLRRRMSGDPWLRPLLLQRHEVVQHMRRALSLLALHAVRLLERCAEALLRGLAHACPPPPLASFSDFFQGLEVYNQVLSDRALQQAFVELQVTSGGGCVQRGAGSWHNFPVERVLGVLASERGRLAAQKLYPCFLWQHSGAVGVKPVPWEGSAESWLLDGHSQSGKGSPSLSTELQALCQEEEELMLLLLGELVASSDSLWHHVLNRPKQEKPLECRNPSDVLGESDSASLPSWKSVRWLDASFTEAAAVLYAQYRPLLWRATALSLAQQLEFHLPLTQFQEGAAAALGQQLSHTLAEACVPPESSEELRSLSLRLLMREVLQHWDQGFCHALGLGLTDKCMVKSALGRGAACSPTAQRLQSLCLPLAFSLRCLDAQHAGSTAGGLLVPAGLRLQLLSLLVATSHASCYWVMSKAYQHLASWSLSQFLLVTQGDLQLLKAETDKMLKLGSTALPKGRRQSSLASQQEQELSLQIHSTATRIQLFARDVLQLFSSDCKRMSAEIFGQTMPLGKHWRLALRTELPSSPSEYASAAAQTVLGQVLQGIQLLPRDAQVPALGQVTTAFLEAWMEHILAQKIKFSLQGALQLKQDFNLVRELLHSEDYGLSPEIRQLVLSLRIFQQVDNAIACLLQQPSRASLPLHTWDAFHKCCSYNGIRTQEGGPGSLNSLESLEGLPVQVEASLPSQVGDLLSRVQGGGCSPETYLSSTQQEWLALRLHGGRRWKVPGLPCMSRTSEP
ncbi:coiled-coil domain-containing protein 142 [Tiliqua scincoides]|uniref:coiled-coil domain-containing protein 142 n=1 Tax=Tiliqua scincoides TaxID=71010 RepID=UPI00346350A6